MKKKQLKEPIRVQDLDRPCYACEVSSKIMTTYDSRAATVVDEYCLTCDREFIEKLIRSVLSNKRKFKLEIRNQSKREKFLLLMNSVLKKPPKE